MSMTARCRYTFRWDIRTKLLDPLHILLHRFQFITRSFLFIVVLRFFRSLLSVLSANSLAVMLFYVDLTFLSISRFHCFYSILCFLCFFFLFLLYFLFGWFPFKAGTLVVLRYVRFGRSIKRSGDVLPLSESLNESWEKCKKLDIYHLESEIVLLL